MLKHENKGNGLKFASSMYYILGQNLANTLQGDKQDVDLAVKTARKAFESWSKTPPHVRARHMYR